MRQTSIVISGAFGLLVGGVLVWLMGAGGALHSGYLATHLLDAVMGFLSLLWLLVVLKVPWDLYFQAQSVAFEQQRARERQIALAPGREAFIVSIRRKLLVAAIGAHLLSAVVIASVTWYSHGRVGYYFAAFYLLSTVFRPAVAAYSYLALKLSAIGEEAHYPREDVLELKHKVEWSENTCRDLASQMHEIREALKDNAEAWRTEAAERKEEDRVVRQGLHNLSREFETTVSRLTDNREVIQGIQAFVRLIAQSTQHPA